MFLLALLQPALCFLILLIINVLYRKEKKQKTGKNHLKISQQIEQMLFMTHAGSCSCVFLAFKVLFCTGRQECVRLAIQQTLSLSTYTDL